MKIKIKNLPSSFMWIPVIPFKVYDAYEADSNYVVSAIGEFWEVPKPYCEVYTPFAMAKETKNSDGSYTYSEPVAVKLKRDLAWVEYSDSGNQEYSPDTHKISILQRGLVFDLGSNGGISVIVSLPPHKFKFPIQVLWNNPDYFEPIYEKEKPELTDSKEVIIKLRLMEAVSRIQDLINCIEKEL